MVSVVKCSDYEYSNCRAALEEALAGKLDFVKSGMKIGIKVNLITFLKPEAAATTHPTLVCALTDMLKARGADVIVGDSPGGIFTSAYVNRVYAATGMREAEQHGAKLNENFNVKSAKANGVKLKEIEYTAWLDECDAIISFAKIKTHGMMAFSAAVKNMFGTIPGTRKPEYHFKFPEAEDFANALIDIYDFFTPKLAIVDAVIGMEGNGPTSGTPRAIGCIVAGENAHEVDMTCVKLINLPPESVLTLEAAKKRGLLNNFNIPANVDEFVVPDFKRATPRDLQFGGSGIISSVIRLAMGARPTLEKDKCVSCKRCAEACPAHAITFEGKYPKIDRRACIRCFCCQEFCPKAAMVSKRPAIARLLSK